MERRRLATLFVLLALFLPTSSAQASGIVTICDEAHLRTALSGGGLVTFACSGTIVLNAAIAITSATTLDGAGTQVTISGNSSVRLFSINPGISFEIANLTLAGGQSQAGGYGGALYNPGGTLTVRHCTLTGNSAGGGGAIYNSGSLTVHESSFAGNSALSGGAVYNIGTTSIRSSSFSGNHATSYSGGALYNYGTGSLTVNGSTFTGNTAVEGGAIYNFTNGLVTSGNSTFSSNQATSGGALRNFYGTVTVSNGTLHANSATLGGGIYTQGGTLTLKNTIVANSPAGGNCSGVITDGGSNLVYADATCPGLNADPQLGPLQANGGPTLTMAPGPRSPALGAGSSTTCAAAPINNLDQRGVTRPQGTNCDIGAVEPKCASFMPPAAVGVEDVQAVAGHWGVVEGTRGWDPRMDLNLDQRIDVIDVLLTAAAFGTTCR